MKYILMFVCCALLLGAGGCNYWQTTKNVYYGYILPADVDLKKDPPLDSTQAKMADLLDKIDMPLHFLINDLEIQEKLPGEKWLEDMLQRHTWLNGVAVVDTEGEILKKQPAKSLKQIKTEQILQADVHWKNREIHYLVQDTPLGPELCVGRAFFSGASWEGVILAHFDLRTLVYLSENPGEIIVFSPSSVLWNGEYAKESREMVGLKWKDILNDESSGEIEVMDREFFWLARYIGEEPIMYCVEKE